MKYITISFFFQYKIIIDLIKILSGYSGLKFLFFSGKYRYESTISIFSKLNRKVTVHWGEISIPQTQNALSKFTVWH